MNQPNSRNFRRVLLRALPLGVLVLALIAVPILMFSDAGLRRLQRLRQERAKVELEVSKLSFEIRQLRVEVESAKTDPRAVEQVARDELGLVRPNDVVLQFTP